MAQALAKQNAIEPLAGSRPERLVWKGKLLLSVDAYRLARGLSWESIGAKCQTPGDTLRRAVERGNCTDRVAARIWRNLKAELSTI